MTEFEALILEKLQAIEARLAGRPRLRHSDHMILSKIIPAIAGARGSSAWTACEIAADPVLRELHRMTAQALGNLFAAAAGENIDGLKIEAVKREHNARLWRLTRGLPDGLDIGGRDR